MRHHIMMITLAIGLSACFADIDVWGSDGAGGETPPDISTSGSTGLGGSETGPPSTTGADSSSGSSAGSSSGERGTTTTVDMPCPVPPDGGSTGGSTGDMCEPSIVDTADGPRCLCADGSPADPMECGCFFDFEGTCSCTDFPGLPPVTCGWPCFDGPPAPTCICGNYQAPTSFCE